MTYLAALLYLFLLTVLMAIIKYLPIVTLPVAIISLIRKKNTKLTVIAIAAIPLIKLFNNVNRNGRGPTETEYFLWQLREGSIWAFLSLLGYVYLVYWWITFLKRSKKNKRIEDGQIKEKDDAIKHERKSFNKIGFLITTGIVLILLSIPFIWFVYPQYLKETPVLTSESPMRISMIQIVQKGQPAFFGPASVKIYYQREGSPRYSIRKDVYNDGGPATSGNFIIDWEGNQYVTITIVGEEGSPETIKIDVLEK